MTRPRDWCGGKAFRDAQIADWRPSVGDDAIGLASAWSHYLLSRKVLYAIGQGGLSLQMLADALDVSYEDQRRKLNGDQSLKDRDVALWTMVTPSTSAPVGDFDGLLPPGSAELTGPWERGQWIPTFADQALDPRSVNMATLLERVLVRVKEAHTAGMADCIDAGALRYFVAESLSACGVSPHHVHIGTDMSDVTIGTPEQIVVRVVSLRAGAAFDRSTRFEALNRTGTALIDLVDHPAVRRFMICFGHNRSLGTLEPLLPHRMFQNGAVSAIGPVAGIDPRWRDQTVELTTTSTQNIGDFALHLIEIGKSHQISTHEG